MNSQQGMSITWSLGACDTRPPTGRACVTGRSTRLDNGCEADEASGTVREEFDSVQDVFELQVCFFGLRATTKFGRDANSSLQEI